MAIIRWSPLRNLNLLGSDRWPEITSMHREMDRLFDSFLSGGQTDNGSYGSFWTPVVDVQEHEDAYVVEAELPGLAKDDVKISIEGNSLTIQGEKKQENTKKERDYHRSERVYGSFVRSFTLPASVKTDKIEANYKNGVLTITVPKVDEAKPKSIEVKVQ